jgi:hypothetical protein
VVEVRRARIVAAGVGMALAASVASVASASAALPEIGRCVAQAGGKYTSNTCTVLSKGAKTSLFEFQPGAVKNHFTLHWNSIVTQLVPAPNMSINEEKVNCYGPVGEGVYTSPTTLEITQLEFRGCENFRAKTVCNTEPTAPASAGNINFYLPLAGRIGKTSKAKAGILLTGTHANSIGGPSPLVYRYECTDNPPAGPGRQIFVEGGIIGEVLFTDMMLSEWLYKFGKTAIPHKQAITHFEGEAEEHELFEHASGPCECFGEGPDLWISQPRITNEEPLEIKAK